MAFTACLISVVSTVCICQKYALVKGSASSGHVTKLEQYTFIDICEPTYISIKLWNTDFCTIDICG